MSGKSKGSHWVTIDPGEIEEKEISYKYERHSPIILKGSSLLYCKYCGLLYLNNSITRWCIRVGCLHEYHRDFRKILNRR